MVISRWIYDRYDPAVIAWFRYLQRWADEEDEEDLMGRIRWYRRLQLIFRRFCPPICCRYCGEIADGYRCDLCNTLYCSFACYEADINIHYRECEWSRVTWQEHVEKVTRRG